MRYVAFVGFILLFLSGKSYGDEKKYEFCLIQGVADGLRDSFVLALAERKVAMENLNGKPKCDVNIAKGRDTAEVIKSKRPPLGEEKKTYSLYMKFKDKKAESILNLD